jgi:hypothetical protein
MPVDFPTIEDELRNVEPSLELLLQLVPVLPEAFIRPAAEIAASRSRDPIAIQILNQLAATTKDPDLDWIEQIVRDNEDLLGGEPEFGLPLRQASVDQLNLFEEDRRQEVLGPVFGAIFDRFRPATANGGGSHAEPPEPPEGRGFDGVAADVGGGALGEEGDQADRPTGGPFAPRRPRFVSTGFSQPQAPREPIWRNNPLERSGDYIFWLEVGAPVRGAIDVAPQELLPDEQLEVGARIRVVLFAFTGGLLLRPDAREGELVLAEDGRFDVFRQPGDPPRSSDEPSAKRQRRLFFPVSTPAKSGVCRLRANLYFRNVLVESQLVSAYVGRRPAGSRPALATKVDFRMARLLSGAELGPIRQHAISIQLNSGDGGTHEFRFFGENEHEPPFVANATVGEGALTDLIGQARGELRRASWGTNVAWTAADRYRYLKPQPGQLERDLFALMAAGSRIYDALMSSLNIDIGQVMALHERMLPSGRVQIVSRGSPSELIPASIFYDYDNANPDSKALTICPKFTADRASPDPLEEADCFNGKCPSQHDADVVCPSGFWGFRHALGMPVAIPVPEAVPSISRFDPLPTLGLAVYPDFKLIKQHESDLAAQVPGWNVEVAATFKDAMALLKSRPHILYFYCHGGLINNTVPYLRVGKDDDLPLERRNLRLNDLGMFKPPRSLVVINGCHTAALEPDRAIDLVSGFVGNAGSMGVIGTEVTIFEELATAFGSGLLHHLRQGTEVGESVRRTRLALLKQGNPLGLVYLPFVAADSRFVGPN